MPPWKRWGAQALTGVHIVTWGGKGGEWGGVERGGKRGGEGLCEREEGKCGRGGGVCVGEGERDMYVCST